MTEHISSKNFDTNAWDTYLKTNHPEQFKKQLDARAKWTKKLEELSITFDSLPQWVVEAIQKFSTSDPQTIDEAILFQELAAAMSLCTLENSSSVVGKQLELWFQIVRRILVQVLSAYRPQPGVASSVDQNNLNIAFKIFTDWQKAFAGKTDFRRSPCAGLEWFPTYPVSQLRKGKPDQCIDYIRTYWTYKVAGSLRSETGYVGDTSELVSRIERLSDAGVKKRLEKAGDLLGDIKDVCIIGREQKPIPKADYLLWQNALIFRVKLAEVVAEMKSSRV